MTDFVAEVEVIGGRVVEVDSAFYESQSQNACVKIDVLLRIAGYRGDVMDAGGSGAHLCLFRGVYAFLHFRMSGPSL
jgi:hypothetical protein